MRASLCRMAPVRPHADKQVTLSGILIAPWEHSQAQLIAEDGVRNDGELRAMLAADNRHRGVVSTSTAGPC
jgi:hypothetical protein